MHLAFGGAQRRCTVSLFGVALTGHALFTQRDEMLSVFLWLAFAQTIVAASHPWWRRDAFQVGMGLDSLDREGEVRALFGACVAFR